MTLKISNFRTDKPEHIEGVWEDIGQGASVKVARINNPNYLKVIRRFGKSIAKKMSRGGGGQMDLEAGIAAAKKAYAETILLDWKGIIDDDGNEIPYSKENALMMITNYHEFFTLIQELAGDEERFETELLEDSAKNLEPGSDGP